MKCLYCGQEIGLNDTICKCCGAPQAKQRETAETVEERHIEQSIEEYKEDNVSEQVLHEGRHIVESKPDKTTRNVIIALIILIILLICCAGGYVLSNMTSYSNSLVDADAELIDPTDTFTDAANITEEPDKEEQILQRARYIFENLPDHKNLNDVDKTVFSPSFLIVLKQAFAILDELEGEDALDMDGLCYWYVGQDADDDDGLQDISLQSFDDETAVVKVRYKNCGYIGEHKMRLVCSDGQWLCDNWDDMKEGLLVDINIVLSAKKQAESSLKFEVYRCIVDSIRGRVGPGKEYDEDEDWWSNIKQGEEVWYLNNTTNGYHKCLIRGYRSEPCIIWIPKDCLEPVGKREEVMWSQKTLEEYGCVKKKEKEEEKEEEKEKESRFVFPKSKKGLL
jgi:hypothetical protein